MKKLLPLLFLLFCQLAWAEDVSISHNGIMLNANLKKTADWPASPTVIITHGTLFHNKSELMVALQNLLHDRGINSLAINLGLGVDNRSGSPYDCNVPHTHKHDDAINEIAAWADWLKTQGVEKYSVIGHSRGGAQTALYAAEKDNDSLEKVVLIAPMSWDLEKESKAYSSKYKKDLAPLFDKAMAMVKAGKSDEQITDIDFIYCEKTSASAAAVISYYEDDPRKDTASQLEKANKPVQVYVGTEDKIVEGLEEKLAGLVDAGKVEVNIIDGADHFFLDLYAEDVADGIAAFVNP
jgi:pimeloyl-ACP methyl ester carboxylesterase